MTPDQAAALLEAVRGIALALVLALDEANEVEDTVEIKTSRAKAQDLYDALQKIEESL